MSQVNFMGRGLKEQLDKNKLNKVKKHSVLRYQKLFMSQYAEGDISTISRKIWDIGSQKLYKPLKETGLNIIKIFSRNPKQHLPISNNDLR